MPVHSAHVMQTPSNSSWWMFWQYSWRDYIDPNAIFSLILAGLAGNQANQRCEANAQDCHAAFRTTVATVGVFGFSYLFFSNTRASKESKKKQQADAIRKEIAENIDLFNTNYKGLDADKTPDLSASFELLADKSFEEYTKKHIDVEKLLHHLEHINQELVFLLASLKREDVDKNQIIDKAHKDWHIDYQQFKSLFLPKNSGLCY